MATKTIGIVGARGHTGAELIKLIAGHPDLELAFVSSRELDGQRLDAHSDAYRGDLAFVNFDPAAVAATAVDVVVLALPNGKAAPYVDAIDKAGTGTVIVDLSADYRFDERWYYGLPELYRDRWRGEKRISNPGCYATAIRFPSLRSGSAGRAAGVLRCLRLFRRGHDAIRPQRPGEAAR